MILTKKLLKELDEVLQDRKHQSRSKEIRNALKDYIIRYKWMKEMKGERIGIILVIYDKNSPNVLDNLTDIQHNFRKYINSVLHVYLNVNQGLEVIVIKGDMEYIRCLTEKIMKLKGIVHTKLTISASY